jgi:hypothetical protein
MSAFLADPERDALQAERDALQAEYERRLSILRAKLARLDELASRSANSLGVQASPTEGVAAVLSRRRGEEILGDLPDRLGIRRSPDYVAATFSFEHATRDDVEKTRNDWDFVVQERRPGQLELRDRTVVDDRGRIWDMGPRPLSAIGTEILPEPETLLEAPDDREYPVAQEGHGYLIHTLDRDSDHWTAVEVLRLTEDGGMVFHWRRLPWSSRLGELSRSAGGRPLDPLGPVVHVRMQTGAGGGNPNRVFLDGTKNGYLDEVSSTPIDVTRPLNSHDRSIAWVESGSIPDGRIWVVTSIDYAARTPGDGNGHGEFVVGLRRERLVEVPRSQTPSRGRWTGRLELHPGDESRFYVELANSSSCDLTIQGHFENAPSVR